jgi:hypothetical protein
MDAFAAGAALIRHFHERSNSLILIDLPEDNAASQDQDDAGAVQDEQPEHRVSQDSVDPTASRPDVPRLDLGSVRIDTLWYDDDDPKDTGEHMA